MAKIVIDARIINSSTGRYVERLLTYLQEIDTTNQYIVLVPTKDLGYWQPKNENFSVRAADFASYSLDEQFGFNTFLKSLSPDLVHFCMPQQPVLYRGAHVTTVHDLTLLKTYNSDKNWLAYHLKQLVGRAVFWVIARTSRHILVPSLYTRRELVKFARISRTRVTVTYEGADTNTYQPQPVKLPYEKYIMYVGQQSDYKNIRRLVKAHQKLLEQHPDLGLVLVGAKNKSAQTNETWVEENHYQNVLFTGFVSNQELVWLYQNCESYVFPSLMEGFGLPGLEAMAEGAPVVSSNATCLPEIYGSAAHYFNPLDIDDMAAKIGEVLSDETLRKNLVEEGRRRLKRYSWAKMAKQTHVVYIKALQGRK
jgi:glycosyltransferase involved in cell wall biosynthesis